MREQRGGQSSAFGRRSDAGGGYRGEAENLARRAGLIDDDGNITEKGRERAFSIYSQIADVFDVRPVDPGTLYGRWSAQGRS